MSPAWTQCIALFWGAQADLTSHFPLHFSSPRRLKWEIIIHTIPSAGACCKCGKQSSCYSSTCHWLVQLTLECRWLCVPAVATHITVTGNHPIREDNQSEAFVKPSISTITCEALPAELKHHNAARHIKCVYPGLQALHSFPEKGVGGWGYHCKTYKPLCSLQQGSPPVQEASQTAGCSPNVAGCLGAVPWGVGEPEKKSQL